MMAGLLKELLTPLIKPLVLLSLVSSTDDNAERSGCFLEEPLMPHEFSREGDIMIGGVLQVYRGESVLFVSFDKCKPSAHFCILSSLQYFRHLLAFLFAIEEINSRKDILPNVTLGYTAFATCISDRNALLSLLSIISGRTSIVPNYSCNQRGKLAGIVGHRLSSLSISIQSISGIYQYPQLNQYLKNIHFKTRGGEEVYFNEEGHFFAKIDILNFAVFPNKSLQRQLVGYYEEVSDQFHINSGAIVWSPKFSQMPTSLCSASCHPGYKKIPQKSHQECCYDCAPCPEGEITNKTDMERCVKCPEDHWSNMMRDACIPRTIEFLSYNDPVGLCLVVIALLFCLLTTLILLMFIKYKHTAIVKANNRNLSFILLLSLILSFLCPLLFIGQPTKMTCLLRQVAFGNIFTIAVSSVLAKTITVVLAFRATKPDRSLRRYLGRHLASSLLLVSCFGEFLVCVLWLCLAPPFTVYNTEIEEGKIILQCNEGSAIAFYMAIGYIGFLALLSFIVAFMARKLPDTFNEAQYITFSMLVFCSVWISFIPAYISTKGKFLVAVEVFTILASSAGLLGCIFFPKCYIILLRPELNTKSNVVVRYGNK